MVIVAYKNRITMQPTFQAALEEIFSLNPGRQFPQEPRELPSQDGLIRQAVEYYKEARRQLEEGDWVAYGEYMARLQAVMEQLEGLIE